MSPSRTFPLFLLVGCASQTMSGDSQLMPAESQPEPEGVVTEIESEWEIDEEGGCPDSWVLTYGIDGRIDITNTPLNIGNADALVGGLDSDEIVLRIADDNGVPDVGQILVTSFKLLQDFDVSVNLLGEIFIITELMTSSADECGVASGQLDGDVIYWDECYYGPEHGSTSWSPDEGAYGTGCLRDYHVDGVVECVDGSLVASCEDGWLNEGINNLDYVHDQPLLDFEFDSRDLESFIMRGSSYGTELPTFTNNRTWLTLYGELKSMTLEPTPDCLCTE